MPSIYLNGVKYSSTGANGQNVVVAKIEPIINGNRVTFSYYDELNIQKFEAIEIYNGEKGTSVAKARIENGSELILTLSDNTEISAGNITIDESSLSLENYYDKTTIDTLLANQKDELTEYIDEKVASTVEETVDTVTEDDILSLF